MGIEVQTERQTHEPECNRMLRFVQKCRKHEFKEVDYNAQNCPNYHPDFVRDDTDNYKVSTASVSG